jgi:D-alanyl-D-alanine carboxypeptidase
MKLNHAGVITGALLTVALTTSFILLQQPSGLAREDKQDAKQAPANTNRNEPNVSVANDSALAREIDRILGETDLTRARFGVFVMSPKDGRVLYAHDSDQLFTPASNMKVYTTAVAIDLLDADYRWRTSVT